MNRARGWAPPQRRRPVRRCHLLQALSLLCAATALGLAGCGSPSRATPKPTPTPTLAPTSTDTPTPTPNPDTAIISDYEEAVTTFDHLASIPEDDAAGYAELQQWYTGQLLTSQQQQLEIWVSLGQRLSGTYQFGSPVVTSVDDKTAQVQDCFYNGTMVVNSASGQANPGQVTGYVQRSDTLLLQDGTWRVSLDTETYEGEDGCSAASPSP